MVKSVSIDIPRCSQTEEFPFLPRNAFAFNTRANSLSHVLKCNDPSLTKQEFTEECDINNILARFANGGDIVLNARQPRYGDFTNMPSSYHEALTMVREAELSFMSLDAKIRKQFDNDVGRFLAYCADPENKDQLVKWGLAVSDEPSNDAAPPNGAVGGIDGGGAPASTPSKKPSKNASNAVSGGESGEV